MMYDEKINGNKSYIAANEDEIIRLEEMLGGKGESKIKRYY